jgi:hypothetical protein
MKINKVWVFMMIWIWMIRQIYNTSKGVASDLAYKSAVRAIFTPNWIYGCLSLFADDLGHFTGDIYTR